MPLGVLNGVEPAQLLAEAEVDDCGGRRALLAATLALDAALPPTSTWTTRRRSAGTYDRAAFSAAAS